MREMAQVDLSFLVRQSVILLWTAWFVYWTFTAWNTKATHWRESWMSRALYTAPLVLVAFLLTGSPAGLPPVLRARFVPIAVSFLGVLLVMMGLGLAIWARHHLGRNWSAGVTVKAGHSLVRSGPYRFIRHPIYTGLLLAILGTAVVMDEWRALVAFVLVVASLITKSRIEERRMSETFPEYEAYRQQTAALVPYLY